MRAFFLAALAVCTLLAGCGKPASFNATDLSGAELGRGFQLNDHLKQSRRLDDFRGKVVVMFFGYTQCPDVCPTNMSAMREVMTALGKEADRVQVLFVTVDPERDTPELLAQYVPAFHPSFIGLYGDAAATAATASEFKIFYQKQAGSSPTTYTVDHSAGSYVFDPKGRLRLYLRHGEMPQRIAQDISRLLAGE